MLRIPTQRYSAASTGTGRAEVVSSVTGACDECGAECEPSRHFDDSQFYQAMTHEQAKSAGYVERMKGNLRQLICPQCQVAV